jgi:hypothetical protein
LNAAEKKGRAYSFHSPLHLLLSVPTEARFSQQHEPAFPTESAFSTFPFGRHQLFPHFKHFLQNESSERTLGPMAKMRQNAPFAPFARLAAAVKNEES